jgi:hypothetical protein
MKCLSKLLSSSRDFPPGLQNRKQARELLDRAFGYRLQIPLHVSGFLFVSSVFSKTLGSKQCRHWWYVRVLQWTGVCPTATKISFLIFLQQKSKSLSLENNGCSDTLCVTSLSVLLCKGWFWCLWLLRNVTISLIQLHSENFKCDSQRTNYTTFADLIHTNIPHYCNAHSIIQIVTCL